jgi:hypothetical protein
VIPALVVVVAAVLLSGCGPPTQYQGPIPFDQGGVAHRMRVLCRLGLGSPDVQSACQTPSLPRLRDNRPAVGGEVEPIDHR